MAIQELLGEACGLLSTEGVPNIVWGLSGIACLSPSSDGMATAIRELYGDSFIQLSIEGELFRAAELSGMACLPVVAEGRTFVVYAGHGETVFTILQSIAKAQLHLHPCISTYIQADARPYLGAGVKLTYNTGTPFAVTRWELLGMDSEGWEADPMGTLKWTTVRANADGLAVNYYQAPDDESCVGRIDRITVDGRML